MCMILNTHTHTHTHTHIHTHKHTGVDSTYERKPEIFVFLNLAYFA
jgi:hypothetical protein